MARDRGGFYPHQADIFRVQPATVGVISRSPDYDKTTPAPVPCQITRTSLLDDVGLVAEMAENHARVVFPGDVSLEVNDIIVERTPGPNAGRLALKVKAEPSRVSAERRLGDTGTTMSMCVEVEFPNGVE